MRYHDALGARGLGTRWARRTMYWSIEVTEKAGMQPRRGFLGFHLILLSLSFCKLQWAHFTHGLMAFCTYSSTSMTPTSSLVKMTRRYLIGPRPQKQSPDPYIKAITRSIVVDGSEHVVSYGGISQYNRDGTGASACGLAALNFARIVFAMEQSGLQDITLLQAVLARACAEVRRR
jgi:hypothetical protein